MKRFICILLLISLMGCASFKDYEFGDVSRTTITQVKKWNEMYCKEENETMRHILITMIRLEVHMWPADGICGVERTVMEIKE